MGEAKVLAECLEWLARNRVFAWRNNTGSYRTDSGAFVRYGHVGSADIIGVLPFAGPTWTRGAFLAVECKTPSGRQSKPQKVFQSLVERSGGVYVLARSVDDLAAQLHAASERTVVERE